MYRVEDKYTCTPLEMFLLEKRLETVLFSDENQVSGDGYQITSVYFDDDKDTCYHEAIDGVRDRCKYRIRIYNDSFDEIKLELKYKKDSRIHKISQKITRKQMETYLRGECVEREEEKDDVIARMNAAVLSKHLTPKVIVEYDRKAFVYDVGNVRITLDSNLRYSTNIEDFISGKREEYCIVPEMNRVIEVKYDELMPGFIARIIENGNMVQTSFSKFCLCRRMELEYVN